MRTLWVITVAACGLTWNGLSQGGFVLDNSSDPNGFTLDRPGNFYSGGGGIEVWEANTTAATLMAQINSASSSVAAYALLGVSGFKLEDTYAGVDFNSGNVLVDPVRMPDVTPPGATVTVALVAWNTADRSAAAAIADPNPAMRLGVRAVIQPTATYGVNPPVAPGLVPLGSDIVMTAIPEPSWLGLFTLAAAVYWLARRPGLRPPKRRVGRR